MLSAIKYKVEYKLNCVLERSCTETWFKNVEFQEFEKVNAVSICATLYMSTQMTSPPIRQKHK